MIFIFAWVNWRALNSLPAIDLIYPFSFLFFAWLLLKGIEWYSKNSNKTKKK